jgi:hypothetical protein
MPKLLIFAACEKVLVDGQTNSVSLIALLQELHWKLPPGTPMPQNFTLPVQWSALSLWTEEAADAGVDYEQQVTLENPAGQVLIQNVARWRFMQPSHRVIAQVLGLPVFRSLSLKLAYRVVGARDWIPIASFPITLVQDIL